MALRPLRQARAVALETHGRHSATVLVRLPQFFYPSHRNPQVIILPLSRAQCAAAYMVRLHALCSFLAKYATLRCFC